MVATVAHFPTKIVEIFLRKNFGERYFSIDVPIVLFILMCAPLYFWIESERYIVMQRMGFDWPWFVFALVFLAFSIKRRLEMKADLQSFDDKKYSYYSGDTLPQWEKYEKKLPKIFPHEPLFYNIERAYEGGVFILLGIVLLLIPITRSVGGLLFISGACYNLSSYIRYLNSRDMILDKIDDNIFNRDMYDAIMNDKNDSGLRWSGSLPDDLELREEVARSLVELEEDETAGFVQ